MTFYKLTEQELNTLNISKEDKESIIGASLKRKAGKFSKKVVKISLNKSSTIFLSSINFYGGEHFNEPYYYIAEISHQTSESAFSKFWNSKIAPLGIKRRVFNY